jgi:hypothetical protein
MKDAGGKLMAMTQSLSGVFAGDEVKGSLASYTFENMEIASYRILIAATGGHGYEFLRRDSGILGPSARAYRSDHDGRESRSEA